MSSGFSRRSLIAATPAGLLGLAGFTGASSGCRTSRRVDASNAVRRVVSISPSTTETMFAIGAGSKLVGRSRYCDYPPEVTSLPAVGGFIDISLEAVLALRPDLVVGARGPSGPALAERLGAQGISTYFPLTESMDEIDAMILGLASRLDLSSAGERVVSSMRSTRESIVASVRGKPLVRTLLLVGASPIVAAGPGSFLDEMMSLVGAQNVIARAGAASSSASAAAATVVSPTAYPSLGLEQVLVLDPDLILAVLGDDASQLGASEVWRKVRAVRENKVISLPPDTLQRPGPRVAEGLAVLARAVHPDVAIVPIVSRP